MPLATLIILDFNTRTFYYFLVLIVLLAYETRQILFFRKYVGISRLLQFVLGKTFFYFFFCEIDISIYRIKHIFFTIQYANCGKDHCESQQNSPLVIIEFTDSIRHARLFVIFIQRF